MATSIPQLLLSYLHGYQHTTATIQLPAFLPAYHSYYSATCMATSIPLLLFSYMHAWLPAYHHSYYSATYMATSIPQLLFSYLHATSNPAYYHGYYSATCMATSIPQLLFSYLLCYQHTTATIQLPVWLPAYHSYYLATCMATSIPQLLLSYLHTTATIQRPALLPAYHSYYSATCMATSMLESCDQQSDWTITPSFPGWELFPNWNNNTNYCQKSVTNVAVCSSLGEVKVNVCKL